MNQSSKDMWLTILLVLVSIVLTLSREYVLAIASFVVTIILSSKLLRRRT